MSQANKPLIFLKPLSPTLQKLKEVIEENAEAEGIEVFEVDSLEEIGQLLPNLGQCLTLVASPKKCAMMLQANRKIVKQLQSKTILLSPKSIPRKTLDKFMKVGLTECVVEPVNPKTLLYKVRLQLRSIVVKNDEEEEMNNRLSESSHMQDEVDAKAKMRAEKGVIMDEEAEDLYAREKKERAEEVEIEREDKKKKNNYKEEAIDGFYKGKSKKAEEVSLDEEDSSKKKGYQEEAIDGHYKGKKSQAEEVLDGSMGGKKKAKQEAFEEDEPIEKLKKPTLNIEGPEDLARGLEQELLEEEAKSLKKKIGPTLDIEEEEKSPKEKGDVEDLGGHYKGKIGKSLDLEDDKDPLLQEEEQEEVAIEKRKKRMALTLEEDKGEGEFLDEREEEDFSPLKNKKKANLQLTEDDPEFLDKNEEAPINEEKEKKKAKLNIVEDSEKDPIKREAFQESEREGKNHDNKADHLDGYLRGGAAKKPTLETEEDEDLYHDAEREELIKAKKEKKANLTLEDEEKDPLHGEKEYDEDLNEFKKKKKSLSLEEDGDYSKEPLSKKNEEERERRKSSFVEDSSDGYSRGKGSSELDKHQDSHNRTNARADKIKTHYSSKESLKHNEDDWGNGFGKEKKQDLEFDSQNKDEKELIIKKDDLGEQTIDYGQLKKQFEDISIDGVRNKKKEYGIFDNVAKIKTYRKRVMSLDGTPEEMEFEEVHEDKIEIESHQVFEPTSLGMEIAVQVLNHYYAEDVDSWKLCHFIHQKVKEQFKGDTIFYSFKDSAVSKAFYNGHIINSVGEEPIKPKESELEELTRLERKEVEKDYEADLKEYQRELTLIQTQWNEKYGPRLNEWKEFKTPSWKDHTFQDPINEFIFPFYEGVTLMGLAVFIPTEGFSELNAESLEAVFEVARGIIITEYHQVKGEGQIRTNDQNPEPKEEKKSGFFGRLFKKAG